MGARAAARAPGQLREIYPLNKLWIIVARRPGNRYDLLGADGVSTLWNVACISSMRNTVLPLGITVGVRYTENRIPYIKWIAGQSMEADVSIMGGLWVQTWGQASLSAYGSSICSPVNWPGNAIFTYDTDYNGGSAGSVFDPPWGIVYHRAGFAILVYRISDSSYDITIPARIRIKTLRGGSGTSTWTAIDTAEILLIEDKDKDPVTLRSDAQVFWDDIGGRLTIVSNVNDTIPAGSPTTDQASIWICDISSTGIISAPQIGSITVGTDNTTTSFSTSGEWGAKLNLLESDILYGYRATATFPWEDKWQLDWRAYVEGELGGSRLLRGQGASNLNGSLSNYGAAYYQNDIAKTWYCYFSSANYQGLGGVDGSADYYEGRILEAKIDAEIGSIYSLLSIWAQDQRTINDCVRIEDACEAMAQAFVTANPSYADSTSSSSSLNGCSLIDGGVDPSSPYTVVLTSVRRWLNTIYESISYSTTGIGGATIDRYFPTAFGLPVYSSTTIVGVRPTCAPLPARNPNWNSLDNVDTARQYWDGTPEGGVTAGNNSRAIVTNEGWRFLAILVPAPYAVPGNNNLAQNTSFPVPSYGPYGACWFKEYNYTFGGLIPEIRAIYETLLVAIDPSDTVNTQAPLARHAGIEIRGYPTAMEIPIPENVYQPLYIPALDLVFWLHDKRSAWNADPIPMITVTDKSLNTKYLIPSSVFVPTTTFGSDQAWGPLAAECDHRFHNVDGNGPIMKAFSSGGNQYLAVGLEYYTRVDPTAGTPGTTTQVTVILRVTSTAYFVEKTSIHTNAWVQPNISNEGIFEGPEVIRSLAIGDRLLFPTTGPILRQIQ
jgi:hypothetical protein